MSPLVTNIEQYLRETLGDTPAITPWKEERHLAFFLRDRYRFFEARILGQPCLLMTHKEHQEESPATIRNHVDQVEAKWTGPVVYVRERITAYNRKRLVAQKLPFLVPGNQMYLPMVGVDFREHFRKPRPAANELRPSSQVVLIHALLRDSEDLSPTALGAKLGYSAMAMSQALDELEAAGIGESTATGRGRARRLRLNGSKQDVWKRAGPILRSPIKSRHPMPIPRSARTWPNAYRTGLSALAHYSLLAEPRDVAFALSRAEWQSFREKHGVAETSLLPDEPGVTTAEVWTYAPALFARDGWVDRLSLYLSLRDSSDERVQAALEQMVREVPW
jgi:DNA-binding MarR family transcriptional regulator